MTRTLTLHIGLTKTGSSAIQSWLSASAASLLSGSDIRYADLAPDAKSARITSGNGKYFVEYLFKAKQPIGYSDATFKQHLDNTYFGASNRAVVSSETLGGAPADAIGNLHRLCAEEGIDVQIVAFVRDIYEHCWSAYQQYVKRHGYYQSFEEFAKAYANPQITALRQWSGIFESMVVMHYESEKGRLLEAFADGAGLPAANMTPSGPGSVNRSLTRAELHLLRSTNRIAFEEGVDLGALLSDTLIYANQSAPSYFHRDDAVVALLHERFGAGVEWVNGRFFGRPLLRIDSGRTCQSAECSADATESEVLAVARALIGRIRHVQRVAATNTPAPSSSAATAAPAEPVALPGEKTMAATVPALGRFGATEADCLRVPLDGPIHGLRLSLPGTRPGFLHLHRIKLCRKSATVRLAPGSYQLKQSSIHGGDANGPAALLSGSGIHTLSEVEPYWQIDFREPLHADLVKIYNRRDGWGFRSFPLTVEAIHPDGSTRLLYEGRSLANMRAAELAAAASAGAGPAEATSPGLTPALREARLAAIAARFIRGEATLQDHDWRALMQLVPVAVGTRWNADELVIAAAFLLAQKQRGNETSLLSFSLALDSRGEILRLQQQINTLAEVYQLGVYTLTRHGVSRARLLSSPAQMMSHLHEVLAVLNELAMQPVVAYGTLLGAVRDEKFIAHDDDVDVLYCPPGATSRDAAIECSKALKTRFEAIGYRVAPKFPAAMNMIVSNPATGASVDIFTCWQQGDECFIHMERMRIRSIGSEILWPAGEVRLHGTTVPAPANPAAFLQARYGDGWHVSNQFFEWPWKLDKRSNEIEAAG